MQDQQGAWNDQRDQVLWDFGSGLLSTLPKACVPICSGRWHPAIRRFFGNGLRRACFMFTCTTMRGLRSSEQQTLGKPRSCPRLLQCTARTSSWGRRAQQRFGGRTLLARCRVAARVDLEDDIRRAAGFIHRQAKLLGNGSASVLETCRVVIIGLGGGGSRVVQHRRG